MYLVYFYHLCDILSSVCVFSMQLVTVLVHCICCLWLHSLRNKSNNDNNNKHSCAGHTAEVNNNGAEVSKTLSGVELAVRLAYFS